MNENIQRIRFENRIDNARQRRLTREEAINGRRLELAAVSNRNYSSPDVILLGEGLKAGSLSNETTLRKLKSAFIEDEGNIVAFGKVQGGLHALVGQLTGNDAVRRGLAVECLCNLSLGKVKTCLAVAKTAGTYLITFLENVDPKFVDLCAWTLGNLSSCDEKVCAILAAQGMVEKLLPLMDYSNDEMVVNSALYALGHYVEMTSAPTESLLKRQMLDYLSNHEFYTQYALKLLFALANDPHMVEDFSKRKIFSKVMMQMVSVAIESDWESDEVFLDSLMKVAVTLCLQPEVLDSELEPLLDSNFQKATINLLQCPLHRIRVQARLLFGSILINDTQCLWYDKFLKLLSHVHAEMVTSQVPNSI